MKTNEIKVGGEYAVKDGFDSVRRVRVQATGVDRDRGRSKMYARDGVRVEYVPAREGDRVVVPSREIIRTWAEQEPIEAEKEAKRQQLTAFVARCKRLAQMLGVEPGAIYPRRDHGGRLTALLTADAVAQAFDKIEHGGIFEVTPADAQIVRNAAAQVSGPLASQLHELARRIGGPGA